MKEMETTLCIKQIAPSYLYQGPRFIRLGPNSGEQFRDKVLIPWLDKLGANRGFIDFAATKIFSPSFLEEAFGGAIRKGYKEQVLKLTLINIPESWHDDVKKYIQEAAKKVKA